MALGPGKYDAMCTEVRERLNAAGVLLIVISGAQGSGFSCQADLPTTLFLPQILDDVAAEIRRSGIADAATPSD